MGLIHVRVDDRLVHGIVATSWIATWNPNRIICIDKQAAENQVMKSALRIATPSTIALSVLPYDKAKENIGVSIKSRQHKQNRQKGLEYSPKDQSLWKTVTRREYLRSSLRLIPSITAKPIQN